MRVYKLTDKDGYTQRGQPGMTRWELGVTHSLPECDEPRLCTSDVFHAYMTPHEAAFYNPVHAYFSDPLLWKCKTPRIMADDGTKVGVFELTPIRQIELPELTAEQRVEIAVRLALDVVDEPAFVAWARKWLDGTDRRPWEGTWPMWEMDVANKVASAAWTAAEGWETEAEERAASATLWVLDRTTPAQFRARFAEVVKVTLEEVRK